MLLLAGAGPAAAQVFEFNGGSSTLLNAYGGEVGFRGKNYAGRVDFGFFGRSRVGFFLAAPYRGYTWGLGDQPIRFVLPTDLFNRSYYFLGRGLSATRKDPRSRLLLYGGATSTGFMVPFLTVARPETPTSLFFYERELSRKWRLYSHNIVSQRQTSIQSLEWQARDDLKLAMSGGIGSNQHYWASSLGFVRRRIALQASYAWAGDAFRRVLVETPALADVNRENVRLELSPLNSLHFVLGRENYLAPAPASSGAGELRAAVNTFGVWGSAAGFQMYGSVFDSDTASRRTRAMALGARRAFTRRLEAGVDYLHSELPNAPAVNSLISTVREMLTPRLSLSQVVTHTAGQTSVSFGGNFLSNWFTAGVDYQTIYFPLASASQSQFRQILMLNVHLQLPRGIQFHGATNVTPLGEVRYTAYGTAFAYHGLSGENGRLARSEGFYENVARGRVVDQTGQPVAGAALLIDHEMVFSNSQGEFFLRRKKAQEYPLEVALDQFLLPGRFVVVTAPATLKAAREEVAQFYEVVLQRLPSIAQPPAPETPSAAPPPSPPPPAASPESCLRTERRCGLKQPLIFTGASKYLPALQLGDSGFGPAFAMKSPDRNAGRGAQNFSLVRDCWHSPQWLLCRSSAASASAAPLPAGRSRADGADAGDRASAVVRATSPAVRTGARDARRGRGRAERLAVRRGSVRHGRVQTGGHAARRGRTHRAQHNARSARRGHHRVSAAPGRRAHSSSARVRSHARASGKSPRHARAGNRGARGRAARTAHHRHRPVG
ncbi:MAG: carboxypeptidase regulatory-like domain-containing protein [Acidobacteria bacterium]|nr:carboxypeptidase regulatory-like domain-containing protein [Acidobacteriota bacterium]